MRQCLLGDHTGLRVSQFALGTGRLGTGRDGGSDPNEARGVLATFADAGGSFLDTSSAYQFGRAEEYIGTFLSEVGRHQFVVASKYGRTAETTPSASLVGSHRKAMATDLEGSLRRLRTDRIDLYFPHFDDGLTPIEEIMAGLNDLVRAGKILYVGLSNFAAWRSASAAMLADMRGWAPIAALQLEYNLLERGADREHLPLARARGLGVMGYSPLAGGKLTARLRAAKEATQEEDAVANALVVTAGELGCDPSSVALSWVGTKGIVPIIGARDRGQLTANLAASDVHISQRQLERLNASSEPVLGQPYELLLQTRHSLGLTASSIGAVL